MKNDKFYSLLQSSPLFLQVFLKNPLKTGSVWPSSKSLAHQIAKLAIHYASGQAILELGPGTGVITEAMIKEGLPPDHLFLIEYEKEFVKRLEENFPTIRILEGDACQLSALLKENKIESSIPVVVSSLPLQSLSAAARKTILHEIYQLLPKGGHYIQYTYGFLRNMHPFKNKVGVKQVWLNFPPARIYVFKK